MILHSLNELPAHTRIAVALGVFDGVHLGHQAILSRLVRLARETASVPVALFFSPHPRELLCPPGPKHLTSLNYKSQLLRQYGAEQVVAMEFTMSIADMSATDFLARHFASAGLEVSGFCVGENWRFGKGNSAGVDFLAQWGAQHGKRVEIVPFVEYEGDPISSTRLRSLVEKAELANVKAMLGRDFAVSGIVSHGNGVGKKLDCATANIVDEMHVLPPSGVYAGLAHWEGRDETAIVYVGTAPTVRADATVPWVELHLLECNENLYGKELVVDFVQFIRKDRRFSSQEELAVQIKHDIAVCRGILGLC
ncbi:MAG: riboflavin biosynthesis protein RibF [Victivallales bacterium]|nr:riboflavin biosynthesis protein RibF [Victivallales bacterium]